MSSPLVGSAAVPLVSSGIKVVIELYPTPVLDQYGIQVVKIGLDDKGWDFVHSVMKDALHVVARQWAQTIAEAVMLPSQNGERL